MLTKKTDLLRVRLEPELYNKLKAISVHSKLSVSRCVRDLIEQRYELLNLTPVQAVPVILEKPMLKLKKVKQPNKAKQPKQLRGTYSNRPVSSLMSSLLQKKI